MNPTEKQTTIDPLQQAAERARRNIIETDCRIGDCILREFEPLLAAAEAEIARLSDELRALASYAKTVRMDRLDETREFALQTVDWCEGLIETANTAVSILATTPKENQ